MSEYQVYHFIFSCMKLLGDDNVDDLMLMLHPYSNLMVARGNSAKEKTPKQMYDFLSSLDIQSMQSKNI